jgi:SOS response regulatory protein OraA/RecX
MNNEAYQKLLEYALKILSKKRYTEGKMREKLEQFFKKLEKKAEEESDGLFSGLTVEEKDKIFDEVFDRLRELKYLDDAAFAKDYIHDRVAFKPRGKFLLKRELRLKGLDGEIIDSALRDADIDESKMAAELLEKYSKKLEKLSGHARKAKAYQLLAARGFNPDSIYKAIASCYTSLAE